MIGVYAGTGLSGPALWLGLVADSLARGQSVQVIAFLRAALTDAERELAAGFGRRLDVRPMGRAAAGEPGAADAVDSRWAADGLTLAARTLRRGDRDVVVLDEVLTAVARGHLEMEQLLGLLDVRPPAMDVVLTGCAAASELVAAADHVVALCEIKNHREMARSSS
jgi:cob(I)alamin adenosyltransferase